MPFVQFDAPPPSRRRSTRRTSRRSLRARVEATVESGQALGDRVIAEGVVPTWRRVTEGESRGPVTVAVAVALVLQFTLPASVQLRHHWILPTISALLVVVLLFANPRNHSPSLTLRATSLLLIGGLSTANMVSATRLVNGLLHGKFTDAPQLLFTGGAIWATNIIVFALWYWEFDRGGPYARMHAVAEFPDFLFVQMQSPEVAPPTWAPNFVDYLYLSYTNASAFSPTDVLPLSRWAKMTMLVQSTFSLLTAALIVARAVNIL